MGHCEMDLKNNFNQINWWWVPSKLSLEERMQKLRQRQEWSGDWASFSLRTFLVLTYSNIVTHFIGTYVCNSALRRHINRLQPKGPLYRRQEQDIVAAPCAWFIVSSFLFDYQDFSKTSRGLGIFMWTDLSAVHTYCKNERCPYILIWIYTRIVSPHCLCFQTWDTLSNKYNLKSLNYEE